METIGFEWLNGYGVREFFAMKVIVVGAGLIGITTAYYLLQNGCDVTVVERNDGVALETSYANGGLLTPSMPDPWNAPGCWRTLLSSIGRGDAALQLHLRALPSLLGWGVRFLRNSRRARFAANVRHNLRLAQYSLNAMRHLREKTGVEYGRSARGTLRVFRDDATLREAASVASRLSVEGLRSRTLSSREAVDLEPVLSPLAAELSGAIHYEADEVGDARKFCVALAKHVADQGVQFKFGCSIVGLETSAGRISALASDKGRLIADAYVVAAGPCTTKLLRRVGIGVPVRPAKGYSITFTEVGPEHALRIPIIDDTWHAAVVPIEGAIRVAGTAEFAGFDHSLPQARIDNLLALLRRLMPKVAFDISKAKPWCGLRPMCADGVPIIGPTPIANLLVNTGHGHLGWTMAAGSASLLSEFMRSGSTDLDIAPYSLSRFS